MRTCRYCNESQDESCFGHNPQGGLRWKCRKCMRQAVAKHSQENPDLVRNRARARKERESKTLKDYLPLTLKLNLAKKQNNACFYCKEENLELSVMGELDHMTPIVQGGADIRENIVLACSQCNKEKHNKTVDEYREWIKRNGEKANF